jgi:subtilisin-like proprotein convertase family protein
MSNGSHCAIRYHLGRKLALGMLATTLIATSTIPAIADRPHQERHDSRHTQQEQGPDAARKGKGKKSKTVTRSFANDGTIAIPAPGSVDDRGIADPYGSSIDVSGFRKKPKVTDINVTFQDFSHELGGDVSVLLVAPGGRNALIMSDVGDPDGDEAFTKITLTLDDEATNPLPVDERLTSGSFRPVDADAPGPGGNNALFVAPAPTPSGETALSTFDGINPNGEWQIFVLDHGIDDTGVFEDGWELEITAKSKAKNKNKGKR